MKAIVTMLALYGALQATVPPRGSREIPRTATNIETRTLATEGFPQRAVILWMLNPTKHPYWGGREEPYTCPDMSRGSHFSGPTRVSLLDTASKRVINTTEIEDIDGNDSFDVPYQIRPEQLYHTEKAALTAEVKPTIIWLRDFTGEGRRLQFKLADALACMPVVTTLVGYVPERDEVIHYAVRLSTTYRGKTSTQTSHWIDYMFIRAAIEPGHWKYQVDYTGRGGTNDVTDISFDRRTLQFVGSRISK